MTSTVPLATGVSAPSDLSLPALRPLTRRKAHDRMLRLCQDVLRRMARRRMH